MTLNFSNFLLAKQSRLQVCVSAMCEYRKKLVFPRYPVLSVINQTATRQPRWSRAVYSLVCFFCHNSHSGSHSDDRRGTVPLGHLSCSENLRTRWKTRWTKIFARWSSARFSFRQLGGMPQVSLLIISKLRATRNGLNWSYGKYLKVTMKLHFRHHRRTNLQHILNRSHHEHEDRAFEEVLSARNGGGQVHLLERSRVGFVWW